MRALVAWGPALAGAAVLLFLGGIGKIPHAAWVMDHDKIVHLGLYVVLAAALVWGRQWSGGTVSHWKLLALGVLLAVADEGRQFFVAGRTPSVLDLFADLAGLALGYFLLLGLWALVARKRSVPAA